MILSLKEIIDMIIMVAFVGFIFSGFIRLKQTHPPKIFEWENFKFAAYLTAPALIFHELAHKFVAIGFGFEATFHAAYFWLILGTGLRLMGFPFIFFVPAFVSIPGAVSIAPLQYSMIAFAGPAMNALLWLGAWYYLKNHQHMGRRKFALIYLTKQINMFLFIFNMLPIPGFDGSKVFSGLAQAFG
ncbi:hypothetical protein ACFLZ7_04475 [Nanoarchaeota archaeon]